MKDTKFNQELVRDVSYDMSVSLQFNDGTLLELKDNELIYFMSHNDYMHNLFPVTEIKFRCTFENLRRINTEIKDLKVFITTYAVYNDSTIPNQMNINKRCLYSIILDCITEKSMNTTVEDIKKMQNNENSVSNEKNYVANLFLFNNNFIAKTNIMHNFILNNATTQDALINILYQSKINNLLVSDVDNIETYSNIIIPPLNFKNSLLFLQKEYGVYQDGLRVYCDYMRCYILNKNIFNMPIEDKEIDTIYIYIGDNTEIQTNKAGGYVNFKNNIYYYKMPNVIEVNNIDNLLAGTEGNNIKIVTEGNVKKSLTVDNDKINHDQIYDNISMNSTNFEKEQIIYDTTNNNYLYNELKNTYSQTITIDMPLMNIDVGLLTPNKKYYFNFNNPKVTQSLSGNYRLETISYSIGQEENAQLSLRLQGTAKFTKIS